MTMLVSMDEARNHLRIDSIDEDPDLILKIHAASGAVLGYLKSAADKYKGEDGEFDADRIPFEVKASVLLMLGYLSKDRDNDDGREYEQGFLPRPVTALLYPLRDPALA